MAKRKMVSVSDSIVYFIHCAYNELRQCEKASVITLICLCVRHVEYKKTGDA